MHDGSVAMQPASLTACFRQWVGECNFKNMPVHGHRDGENNYSSRR